MLFCVFGRIEARSPLDGAATGGSGAGGMGAETAAFLGFTHGKVYPSLQNGSVGCLEAVAAAARRVAAGQVSHLPTSAGRPLYEGGQSSGKAAGVAL